MLAYMRFSPLSDFSNHHLLNSNNNGTCPDGVQWIWTAMGDCAVTIRQQASAYMGLLSIITWILVGVPQIIKNFRNIDGMSGVSFLLLFQWTAGDGTNLTGAILTNQLKPQIYLAIYFVISDIVLLLQYLIYYVRTIRQNRMNGEDRAPAAAAPRVVLCVVCLMCLTNYLSTVLLPSAFRVESNTEKVPLGHVSRFLLSADSNRSLLFRSEAGVLSGGLTDFSSSQHASPTFWNNTKDIIGYTIGCISSVFYIGSRLAQLHKNYKKKSTDGLALFMFLLAVLGNIFYGAQILIQDLEEEFILEHTPWIIGSLGVVFLDCTVLWQFYHYRRVNKRQDEARQSLLHQEDYTINADASIQQHVEPREANGYTDALY